MATVSGPAEQNAIFTDIDLLKQAQVLPATHKFPTGATTIFM